VSERASPTQRAIPVLRAIPCASALTLLLAGCYSVPQQRKAVDAVTVSGASAVPANEIARKIATAPSPRFLGLFRGVVFEYRTYDKYVVQRDVARIERYYRARGYYEAKVRAARVVPVADDRVKVEFVIDEGEPVHVELVRFEGLESVPFELQARVMQAVKMPPGTVFDEDAYEAAKSRVLETLTNKGYAWAQVKGDALVNLVTHRATVTVKVRASHRFKLRKVIIEGLRNTEIPEGPVRRALNLRPGEQFSTDDLDAAKNALLDLGVFANVEIRWPRTPEALQSSTTPAQATATSATQTGSQTATQTGSQTAAQPGSQTATQTGSQAPAQTATLNEKGEPAVDVAVVVTPSLLHTVRIGGGGEIDVLRTDVHANLGWEDRSFLGGLRRLAINVKPGAVLFPTTLPTLRAPTRLLPELRARIDLRQPGFPEARTNWLLRGEGNIYPILLRPINEEVILGYRELKSATGFERNFFGGHFYAAVLGHAQANFPFTYVGPLDPTLGSVSLRFLELQTDLSFRDDSMRPHKGVWFGNNLQLAGALAGGDIADVKVQPDLRLYVPISRTVTFAVRASVGFLFPRNYGSALAGDSPDPEAFTRDIQLLYFRAFFAGGPNSNRGYPFRGIGPHGAAPFFSPNTSAAQVLRDECNPQSPAYDEAVCAVPLGGLSLWESSIELRFPVFGDLSAALFVDAADVSRGRTRLRFDYPHTSTGAGFRYATPIGPVRFDIGYRLPGLQRLGGELDPKIDGDPGTILGAPIAISLGVGEVF